MRALELEQPRFRTNCTDLVFPLASQNSRITCPRDSCQRPFECSRHTPIRAFCNVPADILPSHSLSHLGPRRPWQQICQILNARRLHVMIINGKKLVAWEDPVAFLGRAVDEAVDEETVSSMPRSVIQNNPNTNQLSAHNALSVRMWCRWASEWVR